MIQLLYGTAKFFLCHGSIQNHTNTAKTQRKLIKKSKKTRKKSKKNKEKNKEKLEKSTWVAALLSHQGRIWLS
jgi:hypothetical protein